jgi:hypothetical protein
MAPVLNVNREGAVWERIHVWLHHLGIHHYEFFTVADSYAHEGNHVLKFTTISACRLCDLPMRAIDVEWRVVGPLSKYPITGRENKFD